MTGDIYMGDPGNGDGLYMWKYNGSQWIDYNDASTNGETEGSSYVSPNKHLILWDGDSWQDIGELEGPEGKQWVLVVKYANDAADGVSKEFVADMDIPSAKWMGTLVYLDDGLDHSFALNNPNYISTDLSKIRGWQWSLFKGQDGYGYEYIFKPTMTNDPPQVPDYTAADQYTKPNVVPNGRSITNSNILQSGWYDEPLEPNANNKYIWMCWRKYDHQTGRWTKFMGKENGVFPDGRAKLWQIFSKSIDEVYEYFHADSSISPNFPATGEMVDVPSGFLDFWHAKEEVIGSGATENYEWNETNRYLFNIEVISYTDGTIKVLDPHYISVFADGIVDIVDYYILDTDGSTAPNISDQGEPTISGTSSTEGTSWWTTNASKTTISEDYPYLWNISKKEYENGDVDWSTPMVVAVFGIGQNGESAVYLDLDNEMDVIQIDENRIILENMTFESTICMYNGTSLINIKKIEVSGEEGFGSDFKLYRSSNGTNWTACSDGSTWTNSNNVKYVNMTLNLGIGGILPSEYSKIQFTVTSVNDDIRTAYYTLVGTTNPSLYSIQLSSNVIIKKENGNYEPSSLSVSVVKKTGSDRSVYTSNQTGEGGFKLYLGDSLLSSYTITSTMLRSYDIGDKLDFELYVDTNDTDTAVDTMMDAETVYVVGEGTGYDDGWLKTLLSGSTDITGALVMTGDLLARRADGKIVAGVLGHNYNTNDSTNVRFFAGNTNISTLNDSTAASFISAINSRASFRVTEGGKLYATDAVISGEITATKLTIGSYDLTNASDASNWVNSFVSISGSDEDYSWITRAFSSTSISGGLIQTGNLLAKDSNNKITAGVMGYNTSASDDIRFFAGTTVSANVSSSAIISAAKSAPFRVDESGNMYARKGQIAGLSISPTGLQLGDNIFIGNDSEYGDCIKISDYNGNVNVFNANGLRMGGSFAAKTAFIVDMTFDSTSNEQMLKKQYGILNDIGEALINFDIIVPVYTHELTLPSTNSKYYIGRRITVMNGHPLTDSAFDKASQYAFSVTQDMGGGDYCNIYLPSGCKFYEDGGKSSVLRLSREAVELIGIGSETAFKGFIVSRRYNINTVYDYGHELRCLGMFKVTNNSSITSITFNGLNGYITASSTSSPYSVTIKTPFKVGDLSKIHVDISPLVGLNTYYPELSLDGNNTLIVKVIASLNTAQHAFKVTIFNFNDFVSLSQDSSTAPYLISTNPNTGLWWDHHQYGTSVYKSISVTVSDNTKWIEYGISENWEGQQSDFYMENVRDHTSVTLGTSKTITLNRVTAASSNTGHSSPRIGYIRLVLHTSQDTSSDISKTECIDVAEC